jgi:hypothetical protein
VSIRLARSARLVPLLSARHEARGAPPHHGGPFCSCDHIEGNLTLSRYHRLGGSPGLFDGSGVGLALRGASRGAREGARQDGKDFTSSPNFLT